ncbi:sensor histidine kinase [Catenibacterium sp. AM22-15]|jgi:two-component system, OmpR family, sensor histidine kinase VanS|uniref:sensor histidine kinase n=2 Tax=Coprobacillaceae TaxID=2810280 RepID=UPI000E3F65A5|nr:HAMP domain-containing sensor histidine kinase [Catenibacterium mitsuokai]MBD9122351.1 sensor histidine kinase [Catenibacterium mitsuokai]MBD9190463.1 sensor histidine kinase [Catenibacterium mitsuokai]RGE93191.1 sensor histidine kinase [Catenibacterium sp. AM22-6LB]RGF01621.1 sensor histidine kinase [Catenibacterium sp. AM22-15]
MMQKLRKLFISSFKWRLLINITLSYLVAFLIYSILGIIFDRIIPIAVPNEMRYALCYAISFIVFVEIFFKLIDFTIEYIRKLRRSIQQVTSGNYGVQCEVEYDDELGSLAANINVLSKTLLAKEKESEKLKEKERAALDIERNAERQKNELITNVAHDLRTPLTTIVGYLELIKDDSALSKEDVHKYSGIAYEKSIRLQEMMDDLFEFTKLDNADIKLNKSMINLSGLIMQMTDEFYPSFKDCNITPIVDLPEENIYVQGDGQLLARVFDNLISNALKYGYHNTDLKIEVSGDEKYATVKVINHGDTIAPEDIPLLFNKFYRTDSSRNSKTGGTGLGLAITKNIVDLHHGDISVTSDDQITTFIVKFNRYFDQN